MPWVARFRRALSRFLEVRSPSGPCLARPRHAAWTTLRETYDRGHPFPRGSRVGRGLRLLWPSRRPFAWDASARHTLYCRAPKAFPSVGPRTERAGSRAPRSGLVTLPGALLRAVKRGSCTPRATAKLAESRRPSRLWREAYAPPRVAAYAVSLRPGFSTTRWENILPQP
jgi:hypothetical protein